MVGVNVGAGGVAAGMIVGRELGGAGGEVGSQWWAC